MTDTLVSGGGGLGIIDGNAGAAKASEGITTRAFALNLAVGFALFVFEVSGFFLLKSSDIGRRLYQPKTYLVPEAVRVEPVPKNPFRWIRKIFTINGEELKLKCGLDGYFLIRLLRAMIFVFAPLMAVIVTVLLPINYNGGKGTNSFKIGNGPPHRYNVTGLDTLSWQNVAPDQTDRYWAHLVCALLAISWALFRIYREKLHFIQVRQSYLLSPEHRLKASARTVLVTNIPEEYQSEEALKAFFDVFVDNDDRSRLFVWVNRDYKGLKQHIMRCRTLRASLEKEELRIIRVANKAYHQKGQTAEQDMRPFEASTAIAQDDDRRRQERHAARDIALAFEEDCSEQFPAWLGTLVGSKDSQVLITEDENGEWTTVSTMRMVRGGRGLRKSVPKAAWLRYEVARCTARIEKILSGLADEVAYPRQNSAFIQFERQMSANMACSLVSHHLPGKMSPRYLDVAPHEILWPNMGITSFWRFVRTVLAIAIFVGMIILWGIPATFLSSLNQLSTLREDTKWLYWLRSWPDWVISLISGPLAAILLALLLQLIVPALCRKLAVLCGAPTRSRREVITQRFYFTFLFIELVLVTSISSGLLATIPTIYSNPASIPTTLATNLPKSANYFFNYLIIQGLGFSASVLFQYLRVLFITLIWPWYTHTPRREAWLQITIPHQMWGNVYPLLTNFAAIALIYSIIAPLMLIFVFVTFSLLWIAYRHNYYYVQRVKVDTHGQLFNTALSQLFAGLYVMELALIGLFFLVRNTQDQVACTAQAIIMIVILILTIIFQFLLENNLSPLYELLPVSLEDPAAAAEKQRFIDEYDGSSDSPRLDSSAKTSDEVLDTREASLDGPLASGAAQDVEKRHGIAHRIHHDAGTPSDNTNTLLRLRKRVANKLAAHEAQTPSGETGVSRRHEVANQLGAAIAAYPDELSDLSRQERNAELKVSYQDPVTREPAPVIWIPQDEAGVSDELLRRSSKYGRYLQYSNAGAYLKKNGDCEITRPTPDVRTDWLLDWVL